MKGVIFDLDGVIVDTAKYHYLSWKRLADELGIPFDEAHNEKLKGVSRRDSLIALLGRVPEEKQIEEWCGRKNEYYLELVSRINRSEMLPGALEMLEEIRNSSEWTQALASSSKNAKLVIDKLGIKDYFSAVVDGNDTKKTKPDPELFLVAAQRLGLTPDQVVVVEDAESGVEAARAGRMRVIGIGDPKILGKADRVVRDLSKIRLTDILDLFR